jgi:hypothetical protein
LESATPKTAPFGHQLAKSAKSFLQLRFASRSASFQQALQALQIPAGRIVHGNFNAALKSDVADPHKNAEGSRQHHEIERGELGADGHVHESAASPIE